MQVCQDLINKSQLVFLVNATKCRPILITFMGAFTFGSVVTQAIFTIPSTIAQINIFLYK